MKHNIFKCLLLGIALSVTFTSCREDDFVSKDTDLGDKGMTILKFPEGPSKTLLFEAFTNIKPINGFLFTRDVANNASLSASASVELVKAAVPAGYTFLPDNLFTLQTSTAAKFTKTATGYNANFAPGDFALDFNINLNGALLDPTAKYAIAYSIGNAAGSTITNSTQKTITVLFTILNQWDGVYTSVDGFIQRFTAPGVPEVGTLSGTIAGNPDLTFTTVDGNTFTIGNLRWFGGAVGVGGIDNLQAIVNPVTNAVTVKALGNVSLANIPGRTNSYNPANKTFTLNFNWNQTANVREVTNLVLTYKGKRP